MFCVRVLCPQASHPKTSSQTVSLPYLPWAASLELLLAIVSLCHNHACVGADDNSPGASSPDASNPVADEILHRLTMDLSNSAIGVRDAARTTYAVHRTGHILPLSTLRATVLTLPSLCGVGRLEHIAALLKQPVDALLVKHRDSFLKPLLARRLRALPTLTQVGYVEAVSYCLKKQVPRVQAAVVRGT